MVTGYIACDDIMDFVVDWVVLIPWALHRHSPLLYKL